MSGVILASTSDLVQLVSGGAQALKVHASWLDIDSSTTPATQTPGRKNTLISSATTTTIVPPPGSSTIARFVTFMSVYNSDGTTTDSVNLQHVNATTSFAATVNLFKVPLLAGHTLTFNEDDSWVINDANGKRLGSPFTGGLWQPIAAGTVTANLVAGGWYEFDSTSTTQETTFQLPTAPIDGAPIKLKFVGASNNFGHLLAAGTGDLVELIGSAPGTFSGSGGSAPLPRGPGFACTVKYKAGSTRWDQDT